MKRKIRPVRGHSGAAAEPVSYGTVASYS